MRQQIYKAYATLLHLHEQRSAQDIRQLFTDVSDEQLTAMPTNMTAVHVIACIGDTPRSNNISIATKLSLSKANITKITTKLITNGFIRRYQTVDNKKEVYYELTDKGMKLYKWHEQLHAAKEQAFYQSLEPFNEMEQHAILTFLNGMANEMK